ncbi:TIGR03087 family PEP-CTERM/XrtA system glycosyltransferase [Methylomonas sp. SURF-2]|uniref:TIGR03087 family PEP-CTERM/XrtA system glycosyltransferase n=1 Tax=Methylomonas subterranea TaxID=2952225 RepID=A0ABT1TBK3_9GAMM|nr:TIGR03087 family PEP-CTERM/XrtA system glycosyltransferase [Methylomonas sp. SURF-2]MCQ8102631.1 TIGR03087 family PEP-CTERM/XrtA system glycosyltransferase [Methylomonas sp. SURF-2]
MTKLLYLVHRIPYPPNKGDKIRSFHFLKALAEQYEVYLGTFIDDPDDKQYVDALKPYCKDSFCVDLQPKLAKLMSLRGFLTGEALSLSYYRNAALQAWVDKTVAEHNIQHAQIFSSPMAQYLENHSAVSLVADFVDVDSDKWRQYAGSKSWPASWVYRREAEKLLDFETHIAGLAKTTLFVSEREAELFRQLSPKHADKVSFVNNGVDTDFFDPALSFDSPFAPTEKNMVFTGAMDYWANVDAVVWFARQVFPLVKQQIPEARFYIVGSKPSGAVLQLADEDSSVIVTGRVDDVRNYVFHAGLVVAPLRIARGIQNKVLEAMAMAKPIVATSAAMEGIPGNSSLQIALADEPNEFAGKVVDILRQAVRVVPEHRGYVRSDFGWEHNGQRLCGIISGRER